MLQIIRLIRAPLLSLVILMIGAGLFSTFIPLRLTIEGYSTLVAGCVSSAYFAGLVLGSLFAERFIVRIGHIRAFAAFASLAATLTMMQGLYINPALWFVLRFSSGIFMAGLFIVIESWLLMISGVEKRGAALSLYMIAFYAAQSGGQFLLGFWDPTSLIPFCITTMLFSFSVVPVSMTYATSPNLEEPSLLSPLKLFKISPFGILSSFSAGMLMGAFFGLAPIYAHQVGMSLPQIAKFMGITILGGFVLQWPIGHLSDKVNRRSILIGVAFITAIFSLLIAVFSFISTELLLILSVFFGGFSFTLYPLSISYTNDYLKPKDLVAATGGLLLAYGFGSVLGPITAPIFMSAFGSLGLFLYMTTVSGILGCIGLVRARKKASISVKEQMEYRTVVGTTPQAAELDPRVSPEVDKPISSHLNATMPEPALVAKEGVLPLNPCLNSDHLPEDIQKEGEEEFENKSI